MVGRQLYSAEKAAAMTNLGFSPLSLPGHTLTTSFSLFVLLSKQGVETRVLGRA